MKTCILSIASVVVCVDPSQAAPWRSFQMANATATTIPAAERDNEPDAYAGRRTTLKHPTP